MVQAREGDDDELLASANELLAGIVDDIAVTDDERVRKAWKNGTESTIEHFKAEKAEPA